MVHGPTIRTLPVSAEGPLRRATEEVIAYPPAVLIANTGLGIRSWFANADSWGLGRALETALARTRIYARGPKASGAVHAAGLAVAARAGSERMRELVDLIIETVQPGERVVVQLDGSWESPETDRLRRAGAVVVTLPTYRWTLPEDPGPALRLAESVIGGRVQAVTFTAGPSIVNWMSMASDAGLADPLREALTDGSTVVGCVGPVCAEVAANQNLLSPHLVQPDAFRLGPMVRVVTERLTQRAVTIHVGPNALVLSGQAVLVSGECIGLSDTEARLLAALAERPNVVLTKDHLLKAVWGDAGLDTHIVEVAIARLRRRLGPHGSCIRSVPRRGYTIRAG